MIKCHINIFSFKEGTLNYEISQDTNSFKNANIQVFGILSLTQILS